MSLKIGIVGLPNVGKSTLFNTLTGRSVPSENYPFCTIDPSVGIVAIPDDRLERLSTLSHSKKVIPAVVEFTDIAGLVEGASTGEGLGNTFLSHIREVDAILEVVRIFEHPDISHVSGSINPMRDIEVINLELILADFATVTRRRANLSKEIKRGDEAAKKEDTLLERLEEALDKGVLSSSLEYSHEEEEILKSLHLLSAKPILYVVNKKMDQNTPDELIEFFTKSGAVWVELDSATEHELRALGEDEQEIMRQELGVTEAALDSLIKKSYELLGLITFFTTGEDETRGWTIPKESKAPRAGAVIHSDFEEKFIKAEIISSKDLLNVGSYSEARDKGLLRIEGKEYTVQDGDVIEFKI